MLLLREETDAKIDELIVNILDADVTGEEVDVDDGMVFGGDVGDDIKAKEMHPKVVCDALGDRINVPLIREWDLIDILGRDHDLGHVLTVKHERRDSFSSLLLCWHVHDALTLDHARRLSDRKHLEDHAIVAVKLLDEEGRREGEDVLRMMDDAHEMRFFCPTRLNGLADDGKVDVVLSHQLCDVLDGELLLWDGFLDDGKAWMTQRDGASESDFKAL